MKSPKHALLKVITALFLWGAVIQIAYAENGLPDTVLNGFLASGEWNDQAEDIISGERLDSNYIHSLVSNYEDDITNIEAVKALGLLVLAEAVAGWGVSWENEGLNDPANKSWKGPSSVQSGKHLMSYAKGGVGIPHADTSFLIELFEYLKEHHSNLASEEKRFFQLKGINFDVLYANGGHCNKPGSVIYTDLNGKEFGHERFGYAGDDYCNKYKPRASTNEKDWQIFRHWIREALRKRDVQKWIIERWIRKYWIPSYNKVVLESGRNITEAFINARIRNSSPVTANCAIEYAKNEADPVAAQLKAYTLKKCKGQERHNRRFGVMKRPVVLYEAFSKPQ